MTLSRRQLLISGGCAVAATGAVVSIPYLFPKLNDAPDPNLKLTAFIPPDSIAVPERPNQLAYLSSACEKEGKWGPEQLFMFINALSHEHLLPVGSALEIGDFKSMNKPSRVEAIHRDILWQSSSIFTYPFKSLEEINYHDLAVWCAKKIGIPKNEARFTSTFDLERQIIEQQFIDLWDKLNERQREALLSKIDPSGGIENGATIVAMSGTAALATLSTTVYFTGFAFYTSMSVIMCTVAGWFGITLPFAAYMTASSTVAVLTGPIGWAIGAICLAAAVAAWAGQANVRKTIATLMQFHCMKAGAFYGAGAT